MRCSGYLPLDVETLCKETFGEEWKKAYSSVTAVVIVQFADTYEELT